MLLSDDKPLPPLRRIEMNLDANIDNELASQDPDPIDEDLDGDAFLAANPPVPTPTPHERALAECEAAGITVKQPTEPTSVDPLDSMDLPALRAEYERRLSANPECKPLSKSWNGKYLRKATKAMAEPVKTPKASKAPDISSMALVALWNEYLRRFTTKRSDLPTWDPADQDTLDLTEARAIVASWPRRRGRPARLYVEHDRGAEQKGQYQCSVCGELGHNARAHEQADDGSYLATLKPRPADKPRVRWHRCSLCGSTEHNARTCKASEAEIKAYALQREAEAKAVNTATREARTTVMAAFTPPLS